MPPKPPAKPRKPGAKRPSTKRSPARTPVQARVKTPTHEAVTTATPEFSPSAETPSVAPADTPLGRMDAAFMASEAQKKLDEVRAQLESVVEENLELVNTNKLLEQQVHRGDLRAGEEDSLVRRLRKQRDDYVLLAARSADALRSTSITFHRAEGHKGSHSDCGVLFCRFSNDLWEEMGGVAGVTLAQESVEQWWAQREGLDVAAEDEPVDVPDYPSTRNEADMGLGDLPEEPSEPIEIEPAPFFADDPEWDPKYAGREARRIRVPDPLKERDQDDPGMPKRASV